MHVYSEFSAAITSSLQDFIHKSLKEEQMECTQGIICFKEDVLAILPTRFGKSVIYQLISKASKTSAVDAVVGSVEYICCNVLITSDKIKDSDVPPIFL